MSASQPVERVVAVLEEVGYERWAPPVTVAGIPFNFAAVLTGRSSLDLVIVIDTVVDSDIAAVRQRVEGLSRALDLAESRRPLTVIVVGPEPAAALQTTLARVARVLLAGVPADAQELEEAVAVLLPLELTTVAQMPESWAGAREKLTADHPQASELIDAASRGADEVAKAVRRLLLEGVAEEEGL